MLSRTEASQILVEYGAEARWVEHCVAVAVMADYLAPLISRSYRIDTDFLWSAALLHDIGRYVTHDPVRHGVAGYNLMMELGHPEEAHVCASHILFGLRANEAASFGLPCESFAPRRMEEVLVTLIDYMIEHDRPVTLTERFSSLRKRNADNEFFYSRLGRAEKAAVHFMDQISGSIGQSLEEVVLSYTIMP